METKKSDNANLEKHRRSYFMLGLIFALALFLAAMEYTSRPADNSDDEEFLDDLAEDMDLTLAMNQKDMVSAVAAPAPSKAITEKVTQVDNTNDDVQKIAPLTSKLIIGDGSGVQKEANVTEALPQTPVNNDSIVLTTVQQLPEYPGGIVEFMKWLTRNLKYPTLAQSQKIQGKVVVSFIVNKDGTISNPKIDQSVDPLLDREALRVIRMMPRWKPGIMDGKVCRTMFAIPINFQL